MSQSSILDGLIQKKRNGKKSLAILIDPDKVDKVSDINKLIEISKANNVDYIFIGGSLITNDNFNEIIATLKAKSNIPVVIFPGNNIQVDANADAILLLSLISGRNPDMLIGQHVLAAPSLKRSQLEIIPTGYVLVNSGVASSASYMSNTTPIPYEKPNIAACTALAGEMLGQKIIYIDAGSGALQPIPQDVISAVSAVIEIPLIVGGGINTVEKAESALNTGADMIVIGTAIERNTSFIAEVSRLIDKIN